MITLEELQERFYGAVFAGSPDKVAVSKIRKYINNTEGLSSIDHFNIYRNSITASLNRALGEIYPVCKQLVGNNFFNAMGKEYMRKTPSRSADLANYGEDFSDFIIGFEHAADLPYLPDVARLEWAWHRAFHAADETGLNITALAAVSENDKDHIIFHLPVSANLIASEYPVHHIWKVNQDDYEGDQTVNLDEGGIKLLVWRKNYDMRIDPLDIHEWNLLNAIQQQTPISELCDLDAGFEIDSLLPHCVKQGWITDYHLK